MPVRQKSNASRRLQLHREALKRREQSRLAEETKQKAQKRLRAERQRDASRRQCEITRQISAFVFLVQLNGLKRRSSTQMVQ